jgi:phage terminase large subunit GpA-like protein
LPHLFLVLRKDGNADVRELIYYFAHATYAWTHHWVGEKHVRCAAAARYQQFERGCTLETADATLHQHVESVGQLSSLDVSTPSIRIAAEQMQGPPNV